MFTKPICTLKYQNRACPYELFVNGGLVACDMFATATIESQPVNHWLARGENRVDLLVYVDPVEETDPLELLDPEASFRIELSIAQDGEEATAREVFTVAFAGGRAAGSSAAGTFDSHRDFAARDGGNVTVGEVVIAPLPRGIGVKVSRTFTLPLPLPTWRFLGGEPIAQLWEADEPRLLQTYQELMAAYQPIWDGLRGRDLDRLLPLFEERSAETDQAYYRPPGTTRRALRVGLEQAFADGDVELAPLAPPSGFWHLLVGSTGKLITFTRTPRASSILWYEPRSEDDQAARTVPVVFRRQNGRFVVTR
jgi:hypothetical protein